MATLIQDLPVELLEIIFDFIFRTNPVEARLESNIKNLCHLELTCKKLYHHHDKPFQKYWKIIFLQFIHVRSETKHDGKEVITLMNPWIHWDNKEKLLEKVSRKSFKRCFAIMNETEKRNNLKDSNYLKNKSRFKISIAGPHGSGVQSFMNRFENDKFYEAYDCLDQIFTKPYEFNERTFVLEMFECGFRYDYHIYHENVLRGSRGLIVMFAINSHKSSYDVFDRIIRSIMNIYDDDATPITICINQIDRIANDSTLDLKRVQEELIQILDNYYCTNYEILHISCKENINIQTAIDRTIQKSYFYNGNQYLDRRKLLERVIKKDTKVFKQEGTCLLS